MSGPDISSEEIDAVNQVLRTQTLSIGPWLRCFEQRVAEFVGTKHAVGVSSGTSGLHLCTVAGGLIEGDLCITTPFSFVATANCLLYERAIPVFVDIDPISLNIDPEQVVDAVESLSRGSQSAIAYLPPALRDAPADRWAGKLRAILPVHTFGQPTDMDPILDVAHRHDLRVIEDACEALGATYKGRRVGSLGDASVFAFYPNKQITTGEGGMIVTDRADWDTLFRSLRNQGRDVFDSWLNHSRLGYNYRLDEMSAALGAVQMRRVDELLLKRERVAAMYNQRLQALDGVSIPRIAATTTRMSWFLYVVRLSPEIDRGAVMAFLERQGVPARAYFSPIHLQPFYRKLFGYSEASFPVTESVARSSLALPFSGVMSELDVDIVCEELGRAIRAARDEA